MANEVCSSMGLIGKNLSGKFIHVVEEHGSNSGFMIGCMIWNAFLTDTSVCLITCHNSFDHYENLAKKLGYSLKKAVENKKAVILDPFPMFSENTSCNIMDMEIDRLLKALLSDINNTLHSFAGQKLLIIDTLSNFMALGPSLRSLLQFVQSCRMLQLSHKELAISFGSHWTINSEDQILLSNYLSHNADCRIAVAGLKTGFSCDVTGIVKVYNLIKDNNIPIQMVFHYKLTDRHVKVFAPGTIGIVG